MRRQKQKALEERFFVSSIKMVKKTKKLEESIQIPEGISVDILENSIKIKGQNGELERKINSKLIILTKKDNEIKIISKKNTRKEKRLINSLKSHIKNMMQGVKENYVCKLKVCSSHFPMTVEFKDNELSVTNLFGEKIPRKTKLPKEIALKLEGDIITIEGRDIELVGQAATRIEQLTRITNRDRRIFEDGIYITEKSKKK